MEYQLRLPFSGHWDLLSSLLPRPVIAASVRIVKVFLVLSPLGSPKLLGVGEAS